jgi:hypothetical protein
LDRRGDITGAKAVVNERPEWKVINHDLFKGRVLSYFNTHKPKEKKSYDIIIFLHLQLKEKAKWILVMTHDETYSNQI